jgi:hypothetical protein
MSWRAAWFGVLLVIGLGLASGCRSPGGLESTNPYERARAAVARAEAGDQTAIHRLVALLGDDDDGVRLYTILALERLTGETYGYRYWADPIERYRAIDRWQDALQAGQVTLKTQHESAGRRTPARDGAMPGRGGPAQG